MTTNTKTKPLPVITGAYRHRDHPGKLILQAADGSCCAIDPEQFNAYSHREHVDRNIIKDAWKATRVSLTLVPASTRAPIKGRPAVVPLSESTTGRSMMKKAMQAGKEPPRDWLVEHQASAAGATADDDDNTDIDSDV